MQRLHGLLAEFLCSMPLKVKELRNRADEIARIEAARAHDHTSSPLNHPRHFQVRSRCMKIVFISIFLSIYSKMCLSSFFFK